MLAILRVIPRHLVLVDSHAESGLVDAAPSVATVESSGVRLGLTFIPARTPGPSLGSLPRYSPTSEIEDWEPWRCLLNSASVDAIELERARETNSQQDRARSRGEDGDKTSATERY